MIYIQKHTNTNLPSFDASCAMYGAIDSALDYKLITFEELQKGTYDNLIRNNLFVGSVEFMTEVFSRIGLSNVRVPLNSNREEEITTLGEVKERINNGEVLFVKPIQIKLFTGLVVKPMWISCLNPYPDDTEVIVCKPFKSEIVSEWRCYISDGKVVDIRNYSGDFFTPPSKPYLEHTINSLDDFPICYTIDVAILENGELVVVEFNDMWAIGNYGMDNIDYFNLLRKRYFEILRKKEIIN